MTVTDEQRATSQNVPAKPSYTRLSAILKPIPAAECCLLLAHWDAAVLKGTLRAVPLSGEHFGKVVQAEGGEKKRVILQDELVLVDDASRAWIAEQRRESRYRVLGTAGKIETSIERLKAGDDSFERLLEIRKKRLKAEQGKGAT